MMRRKESDQLAVITDRFPSPADYFSVANVERAFNGSGLVDRQA